jgi:hypothetical protein
MVFLWLLQPVLRNRRGGRGFDGYYRKSLIAYRDALLDLRKTAFFAFNPAAASAPPAAVPSRSRS